MENNIINNQSINNEANDQYVTASESQIHLETLVTPIYVNTTPAKVIMEILDSMINAYLRDTKCTLINVVQFGFDKADEDNIRGFVRIAVKQPIINWLMDKIENAPQEVKDMITNLSDASSQISNTIEGAANGNS